MKTISKLLSSFVLLVAIVFVMFFEYYFLYYWRLEVIKEYERLSVLAPYSGLPSLTEKFWPLFYPIPLIVIFLITTIPAIILCFKFQSELKRWLTTLVYINIWLILISFDLFLLSLVLWKWRSSIGG